MSQLIAEFFVPGIPKPGGSKTATVIRSKGGGVVMVKTATGGTRPLVTMRDASDNRDWKAAVKDFAQRAYQGEPIAAKTALRLIIVFDMPRPQHHYGSGKNAANLKPSAPHFHTSKPDATKLVRCIEDALTGILWADDSQVASQSIVKQYAAKPGARVLVELAP